MASRRAAAGAPAYPGRQRALALPNPVDRKISGHSNDPRPGVRRDLVPAHVRARQRLLSDVLGLASIAEHDIRNAVGAAPEVVELSVEVVHGFLGQRTPEWGHALTR